ncbi:hypothetical protein DFP72DRAFT_798198 [Ephemerocybe angulata]|uniref:Uncharacterized protein n=1 Tax=Ephemerocybe angulata TaxID=980116 RepID=A0A8H6IKE5_9AGAR|nr:hypothetical protein DFP72DRAFT_798198 [Tulosesus angulatus]
MHELASGITTSLFYSCIKSLISSLKRGGTSIGICPKQLRLVYLCLIFAVVTVWTVCSTWTLVYLRIEYPLYPGGPLGWELEHYNHPVMNLGNSAFIMTTWFSDGFMASPRFSNGIYRCYVVYSQSSKQWAVCILSGFLYLVKIVTGVVLLTQISLPRQSLFSQINLALVYFSIVASLHVLLTLLISRRILIHRLHFQKLVGKGSRSLRIYTSLSSILIESSGLYSAAALFFIVPFALGHPLAKLSLALLAQIQVMSPMLVSYRLGQKSAWTHSTTENMHVSSGGMQFAENPDTAVLNDDSSDPCLRDVDLACGT